MTETWLVAGHAIDIASIAAASAAIAIIAGCMVWDRAQFASRVAFRLTLWIAVSSIAYSGSRVHEYSGTGTGMQVRVAAWLMAAAEVCAVFVCMLVAAHLAVATAWERGQRVVGRLQRWYDVVAVGGSLAVTHPVLYVRRAAAVAWDRRLQAPVLDGSVLLLDAPVAWAVCLAWCAAGVVVCLGVSGFVVWRSVAARTRPAAPPKASTLLADDSSTSSVGRAPKPLEMAGLRQHGCGGGVARTAALHVACYGLLPLATQMWPLACALSRSSRAQEALASWWLYRLANVAPST
ncbi:hypothetical protein H4S06_005800, partial [Coemansia sp. BCRC 34490]